jgi:ABC-type transport system involved in multi-copper enzyme maturation permease subunit
MSRLLAVAANTFRETVRERVLYNLVLFAVIMTLCGLLVGQLSIRQDEKIVKDIGLGAMDVFGTVIAIFIGVGLVSKEIERRSVYPLLAKPLSRTEFLLGKFLGLAFVLLVNVVVMSLGLLLTLLSTGRRADLGLLKAAFGIYLALLLVVALALMFSSITSSTIAAVCTLCVVVAGRFSDVIRNMQDVAPGAPGWLAKVLYYLVPNFQDFDLKAAAVYGDPVAWGTLLWISAYAAAYIAVVLGIAVSAFRRRQL